MIDRDIIYRETRRGENIFAQMKTKIITVLFKNHLIYIDQYIIGILPWASDFDQWQIHQLVSQLIESSELIR